ncbi:MAG TPA: outer membrane protein assembly factor BamD, partial [Nitrospiria bacterium]
MMNIRLIGIGLVVSLGLASCAGPRPPAVSAVTIPAVQRDAFEEGLKAYQEGNYEKAVRQFQSVIIRFPGSALLEETQWMIGKSYEANNAFERALKEYQSFRLNFPNSSHRYEAALRIDFLDGLLHERTTRRSFTRHVGISLSGDPGKAPARWGKALEAVTFEGVRTVVLPGYGANGVYFRTDQASVINESIHGAVKAAHARGFKIWVRLPARRLPWFKVPGEERDLRYDPVKKKFAPTAALDLFNPTTLDRLGRFYLDLAATGADGIVIDEDPLIDA